MDINAIIKELTKQAGSKLIVRVFITKKTSSLGWNIKHGTGISIHLLTKTKSEGFVGVRYLFLEARTTSNTKQILEEFPSNMCLDEELFKRHLRINLGYWEDEKPSWCSDRLVVITVEDKDGNQRSELPSYGLVVAHLSRIHAILCERVLRDKKSKQYFPGRTGNLPNRLSSFIKKALS